MDLWTLLGDIVVLLGACLLLGGIFSRFGQSPLVGYLLAGMVLGGPGSIHAVGSEHEIEAIAELGVALLLFSLGLEFSLTRLKKLGAKPLIGGAIQVVLTIVLASGASLAFGLTAKQSIAFGVMVSLSSTAVVLRMLMERSELEMPHGRNSLAVLLTQDMAVVPLALLMTVLGGEGPAIDVVWDVGKLLLSASVLIAGLFLLNKVAVLALGTLTLYRNRELTVIFAIVTGLGAAWASHYAGISPALGAFVAGMLLGSSAFATQIRADVASLRVVLLTLFFGAAGMVADPIWILKNWYLVAAVSALLTVGKVVVIWAIFQGLGHSTRVASATGLCLAQIGEFAFVLGSIGRASGVVSEDLYALVVSVTIVSFILSALLVPAAPWFGNRVASLLRSEPELEVGETDSESGPDVVIIGFGPAGQIAARPFIDQGTRVEVIDLNRDGVRKAQQLGFKGEIGDATQNEVLEHIRVNDARAVVITIPHFQSAMTVLESVRQKAPHVHVFVRSRYQLHTDDFVRAGAHVVVGDEEQVGERLADLLRQWRDANDTRIR
ncbi:MAG: cation:proton antiporter [Planctomycetia bacterium]|nr:cation:proton antiporter [Planctomycetia bacterium]